MEVQFFYNRSDARVINKILTYGDTLTGDLRDEVNIMNPTIRFELDSIPQYNYAYIPEFNRYYSITDKTVIRDGLFDITFAIDVLMSFRSDIAKLPAVVDKQSMSEVGDEYIDDGSLVTDNYCFTSVYNFPNGFNSYGEYILITAG